MWVLVHTGFVIGWGEEMTKKQTMFELKTNLVAYLKLSEYCRLDSEKIAIAKEIARLRSRISARERYQAMRDMGMVKTPYGWE